MYCKVLHTAPNNFYTIHVVHYSNGSYPLGKKRPQANVDKQKGKHHWKKVAAKMETNQKTTKQTPNPKPQTPNPSVII